MNALTSSALSKYAWREIPQVGLPKRSARERMADFFEIYGLYDQSTAQEQAARCLQCPNPGCVTGCPLCNPIPEWIRLTAEGRFDEAASLLGSNTSLTEICARLCPGERLCEESCILNGRSEPVAIRHIEQFLIERALTRHLVDVATPPPNGKTVAVVGSGPGGLACADELVSQGYAVTVFDSSELAGGLLFALMPEFKVERSVLERRVSLMKQRGVVFQLGRATYSGLNLEALRAQFDAIYLTPDARQPRRLGISGSELQGVMQAVSFLITPHAAKQVDPFPGESSLAGKRVIVIGGGDTAIDSARVAVRRGARETVVVYRRQLVDMPCTPHEYENAVEEGIQFVFCAAPREFVGNASGQLTSLRCVPTQMLAAEPGKRRAFEITPGTDIEMPTDLAILAAGFDSVAPAAIPLAHGLTTIAPESRIAVDTSQQTSLPGVFAGGDLTTGPSLALHAVRDGRRAARGIHALLARN